MTIEGGSRRHGNSTYDETASAVRAVFTKYRQPDAVRAAALANAVDIACAQIKAGGATTIDIIVADAVGFEAYLTGEEAHDTP